MSSLFTGTYGTMYYVTDMKKSVEYYKTIFGLTPGYESPDWTEFDVNGHRICLHIARDGQKIENGILVNKVKGIQNLVTDLKAKGVEFEGELREIHPGAYCVAFRDPSGNRVDLYEDVNRY